MKVKQTRKVGFRVAPVVKEALDLIADVEGLTVADLIRSFVNYGLTADRAQLSKFFREELGGCPSLNDVDGWKEFLEEL